MEKESARGQLSAALTIHKCGMRCDGELKAFPSEVALAQASLCFLLFQRDVSFACVRCAALTRRAIRVASRAAASPSARLFRLRRQARARLFYSAARASFSNPSSVPSRERNSACWSPVKNGRGLSDPRPIGLIVRITNSQARAHTAVKPSRLNRTRSSPRRDLSAASSSRSAPGSNHPS